MISDQEIPAETALPQAHFDLDAQVVLTGPHFLNISPRSEKGRPEAARHAKQRRKIEPAPQVPFVPNAQSCSRIPRSGFEKDPSVLMWEYDRPDSEFNMVGVVGTGAEVRTQE